MNFEVTPDQVEFFKREGYLAVDALTTQEEVAELRKIYDRIFSERAGREEGNQFDLAGPDEEGKEAALPQILGPARYAPELNDTLLRKNATKLARALLGPECREAGFAHAIFKPAHHGAETPWHQDAGYWGPDTYARSISIWVPLQEATPENGCMHFVPRSHELDVVRHQSINNDPRVHGLELHESEMHRVKDYVACPLPPGGCTVHGGYMMHYAPPNRSDIPRRAIILNAGLPGIPREKPLDLFWLKERKTPRAERAKAAQAAAEKNK